MLLPQTVKQTPPQRAPNRRKAICGHCLACSNFNRDEVAACHIRDCRLHPFRTGRLKINCFSDHTRAAAIRHFCLECAGSEQAREACDAPECHLYPYRKG